MAKTKKNTSPKATPKAEESKVEVIEVETGLPVEAEEVQIKSAEELTLIKVELKDLNTLFVGLTSEPFLYKNKILSPQDFLYLTNGEGQEFIVPRKFFDFIARVKGN
jgi:hypothetical protein